jgi:hypothetical protein
MIDVYEAVGGIGIWKETEVRGENLPQCHFIHKEAGD